MLKQLRVIVAAGLCFLALPAAQAAPRDDDLIKRAMELRKIGDDQGALPLLQESYDLSHSPRASAQLGFCEQAIGRWPDAETHLTEALKAGADAWVKKNQLTIEQALKTIKTHIARLEIVGDPAGAEVLINAISVGRLPLKEPIRVSAGEIDVELRAPGAPHTSRTVRVEGGQYQRVILRAAAAPPPLSTVVTTPAGTTVPAAGAGDRPPVAGPEGGAEPTSAPDGIEGKGAPAGAWKRPAKWVSWGLALTAAAVGIYGAVHNHNLVTQFDQSCSNDPKGAVAVVPTTTDSACMDLKNRYQGASHLAVGGVIGAIVFAGVGTVLWLTQPETSNADTRTAAACAPGITMHGEPSVACAFHF